MTINLEVKKLTLTITNLQSYVYCYPTMTFVVIETKI